MVIVRESSGNKNTPKELDTAKETMTKKNSVEKNEKICRISSSDEDTSKEKRKHEKDESILDYSNMNEDASFKLRFSGEEDQLTRTAVNLVSDVLRSIQDDGDDDDDGYEDDVYQVYGRNAETSAPQDDISYCYVNHNTFTSSAATNGKPVNTNAIKEVENESFNENYRKNDSVFSQTGACAIDADASPNDDEITKDFSTDTMESVNNDEYLKRSKTYQMSLDKRMEISEVDIEVIQAFLFNLEEIAISGVGKNDAHTEANESLGRAQQK